VDIAAGWLRSLTELKLGSQLRRSLRSWESTRPRSSAGWLTFAKQRRYPLRQNSCPVRVRLRTR